jgi:uncharacterized protein YcbX
MASQIGQVEALFRYPVKSMGGEAVRTAELGWHGLDGDRRVGLRRIDDRSGFPWLTASKLPELILFTPVRKTAEALPTHVRTPEGEELALFSPELDAELSRRHGSPLEMTHLNRGIFDEASVSLITTATVDRISDLVGHRADVRRFRPNILISCLRSDPFEEDAWVGGLLSFGEGDQAATIGITNRDERCSMVNYDPDSGRAAPEILKAVVRERDNKAGVYGTVIRRGNLAVGQPIFFGRQ